MEDKTSGYWGLEMYDTRGRGRWLWLGKGSRRNPRGDTCCILTVVVIYEMACEGHLGGSVG